MHMAWMLGQHQLYHSIQPLYSAARLANVDIAILFLSAS